MYELISEELALHLLSFGVVPLSRIDTFKYVRFSGFQFASESQIVDSLLLNGSVVRQTGNTMTVEAGSSFYVIEEKDGILIIHCDFSVMHVDACFGFYGLKGDVVGFGSWGVKVTPDFRFIEVVVFDEGGQCLSI